MPLVRAVMFAFDMVSVADVDVVVVVVVVSCRSLSPSPRLRTAPHRPVDPTHGSKGLRGAVPQGARSPRRGHHGPQAGGGRPRCEYPLAQDDFLLR